MIEPHIWVRDFASSVAWYRTVLGFEPAAWYPDEATATWCQLRRGDVQLMLAALPDPASIAPHQDYLHRLADRAAGPAGAVSLYLHVDDADAAYASVLAEGVRPVEPIWNAWWGGRQFTVADPDGHWWTLFQQTG